jgi:hypothetical protein
MSGGSSPASPSVAQTSCSDEAQKPENRKLGVLETSTARRHQEHRCRGPLSDTPRGLSANVRGALGKRDSLHLTRERLRMLKIKRNSELGRDDFAPPGPRRVHIDVRLTAAAAFFEGLVARGERALKSLRRPAMSSTPPTAG